MLLQMVVFLWVIFHCTYAHHIFLIQLSVDGYLGCYHVLAIIKSATLNTGMHVSFWISIFIFFWIIYPGMKLLDHTVILFLVLKDSPYCFPQWLPIISIFFWKFYEVDKGGGIVLVLYVMKPRARDKICTGFHV